MTRVRQIDSTHDWTFGQGANNYLYDINAVSQNINTRLSCFLGDCFFDNTAGIDWDNLIGGKDQTALNLAIASTILNTAYVTGLLSLSANLNRRTRAYTVVYQVQTVFSTISTQYTYSLNGVT